MSAQINLVRTVSFSAAHRYFDTHLSEAENRAAYGTLFNQDGFGHNFLVEAHVGGDVDPLTGMIVNLVDLDRWLQQVAVRFDHQDLNARPEFGGHAPTPERIAEFFGRELVRLAANAENKKTRIFKVRVYEGESLWIDYWP